jgi:GNAT superfamily N-acetyltransferase
LASELLIRPAEPPDVDLLFSLIVSLATYERAPDLVAGTPELLEAALFGEEASAEALVASSGDRPVGFAVFYRTFSTWECRPGIWLEDLFVPEEHRGTGVGFALLRELAAITVRRGYTRLEWAALDWNEPALRFYERLQAQRLGEWVMHRLDGPALAQLAEAPATTP